MARQRAIPIVIKRSDIRTCPLIFESLDAPSLTSALLSGKVEAADGGFR